jgi:hypothetical protein
MKSKVLAVVVVLAAAGALFAGYHFWKARPAIFKSASREPGPFAGKWANVDPQAWGIRRIEIGRALSGLDVKLWSRCDAGAPGKAQECEWGKPASYDNDHAAKGVLSVVWEDDAARRTQQFAMLPDGRMRVATRSIDRSGKAEEKIEYFSRAR